MMTDNGFEYLQSLLLDTDIPDFNFGDFRT